LTCCVQRFYTPQGNHAPDTLYRAYEQTGVAWSDCGHARDVRGEGTGVKEREDNGCDNLKHGYCFDRAVARFPAFFWRSVNAGMTDR
jgi:hypothetical protein